MCDWCREVPGDIFCDNKIICFNCIEIIIERENGLAIADAGGFGNKWRSDYYESLLPPEWEN